MYVYVCVNVCMRVRLVCVCARVGYFKRYMSSGATIGMLFGGMSTWSMVEDCGEKDHVGDDGNFKLLLLLLH